MYGLYATQGLTNNGWLFRRKGRPGRDLRDDRDYAVVVSASDFWVYRPGPLFGFFQPIIRITI